MSQYRIGLIGLGQIAAKYGKPTDAAPYCHAGGVLQNEKVMLAGAADPFEAARQGFLDTWGEAFEATQEPVRLFEDAGSMLAESHLDAVAVCVRGPYHYETVKAILNSPQAPRVIFLEKPPFCSLAEADEIVALARDKGIILTVSYSRHWARHVLKLQQLVHDGLIGRVRSVVAYCGGSVLSFASHTTELVCQFACAQLGQYDPVAVTAKGPLSSRPVPEEFGARGYELEPTFDTLTIEFSNGVMGTQVGQEGEHGGFYADVFGEEGRVRVGMYLPPMVFDSKKQPVDLGPYGFEVENSVFTQAYEQIAHYLESGLLPDCSESDWQAVNEIGFGAIESLHRGERITLPNVNRTRKIFANG